LGLLVTENLLLASFFVVGSICRLLQCENSECQLPFCRIQSKSSTNATLDQIRRIFDVGDVYLFLLRAADRRGVRLEECLMNVPCDSHPRAQPFLDDDFSGFSFHDDLRRFFSHVDYNVEDEEPSPPTSKAMSTPLLVSMACFRLGRPLFCAKSTTQ
jgi:hypothetical protein